MALDDQIKGLREELVLLDSQFTSISSNINKSIEDQLGGLTDITKKVAKSFQNDLTKAIGRSNSALSKQDEIANKIKKGQNVSKDIEKEISKVQKERQTLLRKAEALKREGVAIDEQQQQALLEALDTQEEQLGVLNDINTAQIANKGITGNLLGTAKEYLSSLDKSGLAAKILGGELNAAQSFSLLAEAALIGILNAALTASSRAAAMQRELGISAESAQSLQQGLLNASAESGKLYVNAKRLNEAFSELTQQTGLVGDFGGETLTTFVSLKDNMGFAAEEAGKLSLLSRTQGKNTEDVLKNTVSTVSSLVKQSKVAVNVKGVLKDVANVSDSIAVSLGKNPIAIAEAATEARLFGSNLEQVDKIAGSLLDFESSIANELAAEVLTGKELNLEKARLLALNNDLAGLSQELADNAAITEAFATGNRIQQEAAAQALGMSREELAKIALQQDYNNMSAEQFKDTYGDATYESLNALDAQQQMALTMEKFQESLMQIGTIILPIVDGFANIVTYLGKSKGAMTALAVVAGTLATLSIVNAVANIFSSFAKIPFGIGLPLAGIAALGMTALISKAKSSAQNVQDGIAPSGNGPFTITDSYGRTAITAKGDGIAVSPNINQGGNDREMVSLLRQIASKDTTLSMDGRKLNDSMQTSGVSYNIGI